MGVPPPAQYIALPRQRPPAMSEWSSRRWLSSSGGRRSRRAASRKRRRLRRPLAGRPPGCGCMLVACWLPCSTVQICEYWAWYASTAMRMLVMCAGSRSEWAAGGRVAGSAAAACLGHRSQRASGQRWSGRHDRAAEPTGALASGGRGKVPTVGAVPFHTTSFIVIAQSGCPWTCAPLLALLPAFAVPWP